MQPLILLLFCFGSSFAALKTTQVDIVLAVADCDQRVEVGDRVSWYYDGRLMNGTQFDTGTYTTTIGAGQVIKGVDIGLRGMCVGEKRLLTIPSHEAYGERGSPSGRIPPNSQIEFDVELISIERPEKLETTKYEVTHKVDDCKIRSQEGDTITWKYAGRLIDGTPFDSGTYWAQLGAGQIIEGVDIGMRDMCVGEKRILTIPEHEAYGERGYPGSIPPYATLIFDVELQKIDRPNREL